MATACQLARKRLVDAVQQAQGVSSRTERGVTAMKAGFFGSVPTLARATVGNTTSLALRTLWEAPVSAAVDYVRAVGESALGGFKVSPQELRTVFAPGSAEYRAIGRGWIAGTAPVRDAARAAMKPGTPFGERFAGFVDELRLRLDADNGNREAFDAQPRTLYRSRTAQTVTDGVFAMLEAVDRPTWQAAHDFSLVQQARVYAEREIPTSTTGRRAAVGETVQRYLDQPTDAMLVRALEDANYTTFKNATALSEMAQEAKRSLATRAELPGAAGVLANTGRIASEILFPATRVPSSVAAQAAANTPLGFFKAAAALAGNDRRAFAQAMAQGAFGTAGLMLGIKGLREGWLTGAMPASPAERARWREEGRKPYHVRLGDTWASYGYLGPLAAGMAAGASVGQASDDASGTATPEERAATALVAPLNYLSEQTYMEGFRRLADAMERPSSRGSAFAAGLVPVPAVVRQVARAVDPVDRDADSIAEQILRNVPGASRLLPERPSAYGTKPPSSLARRVGGMLSPSSLSASRETVLTKALRAADLSPTTISDKMTVRGEKRRLSKDAVRTMTVRYRELMEQYVAPALEDPAYQALPPEMQHRVLSAQLRKLRDITRAEIGLPMLETENTPP